MNRLLATLVALTFSTTVWAQPSVPADPLVVSAGYGTLQEGSHKAFATEASIQYDFLRATPAQTVLTPSTHTFVLSGEAALVVSPAGALEVSGGPVLELGYSKPEWAVHPYVSASTALGYGTGLNNTAGEVFSVGPGIGADIPVGSSRVRIEARFRWKFSSNDRIGSGAALRVGYSF